MRVETIVGISISLAGLMFLAAGFVFFRSRSTLNQEIDHIEHLPLLTITRLQDAPSGEEAVIEGKIAERNMLLDHGFVAYIRSQYQGERCSRDDDGNEDCEPVWLDDGRVTPALWLDLPGGRTRLANSDYTLYNEPVIWRSTEWLVSYQTIRFRGFKIGNPIFTKGTVTTSDGVAFKADFIYGGNRQAYLINQRDEAQSLVIGSLIFAGFGLAGLIAGGVLLYISFK